MLEYIEHKKHLILLRKLSKKPVHDDWVESNHLEDYEVESYEADGRNFGWVLGERDMVLDIDPRNGGRDSFKRLCNDLDLEFDYTVKTGGGGYHIYLTIPEDFADSRFKKELKQYAGLDLITKGAFVVAAGAKVKQDDGTIGHYSYVGEGFKQTEAPVALLEFYEKISVSDKNRSDEDLGDMADLFDDNDAFHSEKDIIAILKKLNPDCSHNEWVRIGMALHDWNKSEGFVLWDKWSRKSDKYEEGLTESKWATFTKHDGVSVATLLYKSMEQDFNNIELEVENIVRQINMANNLDLRKQIAPRIANNPDIDDINREMLATKVRDRLKILTNTSISITVARNMVALRNNLRSDSDSPEWTREWIYINTMGAFLNRKSKVLHKSDSFNLMTGKFVPESEKGTKPSSTKYVSDNGFVDVVADTMYLPYVDNEFVNKGRTKVYNSFDRHTLPKPAAEYTTAGRKAIKTFIDHVYMLCNKKEYGDVLIQWMAHNIQDAGVQIGWAPVIQSIQGIGKSYLGNVMRACLGYDNVGVVNSEQIKSSFNGWATNVCVNIMEEIRVQGQNRHEIINALKPLVTDTNIQINGKGVNQRMVMNVTNYICFTNYKDALPLTGDDRRWWVIFNDVQSVDEIGEMFDCTPAQYYNRLFDTLEYWDELLKFFLEYEITDEFKSSKRAPHTEYKDIMVASEESNVKGLVELNDIISMGLPFIDENAVSATHAMAAMDDEAPDLLLTPSEIGRLLKRLGYTKLQTRPRIQGNKVTMWSKKPMSNHQIQKFIDKWDKDAFDEDEADF